MININNDKEVVRGLVQFIKKQIDKKGPSKIIPVEVALYHESNILSAFENFLYMMMFKNSRSSLSYR